ncbi:MAG: sulfite exporter TauE/SafE family protein [Myxococcales bacterium]|nr:sulfite exporter TauE/SafE family protein [Myxococcales bacterium]
MSGWEFMYVLAGGFGAGLLGALMGLGGAIVAIPYLNLLLAVPMNTAAACGLVSTLATSCGASGRNLCQNDLVSVDAALRIQLFTAAGGLAGGWLAGELQGPLLQILFAVMLLYGSVEVGRSLRRRDLDEAPPRPPDGARLNQSLLLFFGAGVVCGLLGVGGGLMVVPLLHLFLHLPFKAAAATSNFMMGLTAVPALITYVGRGELDLTLAIPLATGVWLGARLGSFLLEQLQSRLLKVMFIGLLLLSAAQMVMRGLEGFGP